MPKPWDDPEATPLADIRQVMEDAAAVPFRPFELLVPGWLPPQPKRGGTYLYCPWTHEVGTTHTWCLGKFRTPKQYRKHWRRSHANQAWVMTSGGGLRA